MLCTRMLSKVSEISIRDLEIFVLAARTQSLREVARQLNLLPANTSKIMKSLESKLETQLFRRSINGIILTPEGVAFLGAAEKICDLSKDLMPNSQRQNEEAQRLWTIGSIGFLSTYLLAPVISRIQEVAKKAVRFRLVEFTKNDLVAHGLKGAFDLALHIDKLEWTHTWESYLVGSLKWKLYASSSHGLPEICREVEVLKFPFVVPTDWGTHGYVMGSDFCPLDVRRRRKGSEAATAETALEICRYSNQLTFVPEILAKNWCEAGQVKEISVKDWPTLEKQIYLSVKVDAVTKPLVDVLMKSLKKQPAISDLYYPTPSLIAKALGLK